MMSKLNVVVLVAAILAAAVASAQLEVTRAYDLFAPSATSTNDVDAVARVSATRLSHLRMAGTGASKYCTFTLFESETMTNVHGTSIDVTTWADVPVPAGAWPFFCRQVVLSETEVAVFFGWSYYTMVAVVDVNTNTIARKLQTTYNHLNSGSDQHFEPLTSDTVAIASASSTQMFFRVMNMTDGTDIVSTVISPGCLACTPQIMIRLDTDKFFIILRNYTATYSVVVSTDGTILSPAKVCTATTAAFAISPNRIFLPAPRRREVEIYDAQLDDYVNWFRYTYGTLLDANGDVVPGEYTRDVLFTDVINTNYDPTFFAAQPVPGTNNFALFYQEESMPGGWNTPKYRTIHGALFDDNFTMIGAPINVSGDALGGLGQSSTAVAYEAHTTAINSTHLALAFSFSDFVASTYQYTHAMVILKANAASAAGGACSCPSALTVDYNNTEVADALLDAYTEIRINTTTWAVEFEVHGVRHITNGHVIAAKTDSRQPVATAIPSLVSNYNTAQLWNPPACGLSDLDTPASSLAVSVTRAADCTRSYQMLFSVINSGSQDTQHCTLTNDADDVLVACEIKMTAIRAYDATTSTQFLSKETVFRANITMPRVLPEEVSAIVSSTLAKCSVYAAPDFYVDCRIPNLWNFASTFTVDQTPDWIIGSSCVQTNTTSATFIRCDMQTISSIYTEATATIGATVVPSGEVMRFAVNYSLPREETATASGSLATFVKSIGTKDGKFFYGNDDLLTLEIEVADTSRLQITQLELFNSDSPVQTYDLRTTAEFETVETQNSTFFVITFYPARKLDDSNFYLHGPHGVNVSFLFTAARRQQAGDTGVVTYKGVALKAPRHADGAASSSSNSGSGVSTLVVGIAAGSLVAVVALLAVVVISKKRKAVKPAAPAPAPAQQQEEEEEVETAAAAVAVEMDEV